VPEATQVILRPSPVKRATAKMIGMYEELPMISLAAASKDHDRIDLLHIDIQGGEAERLTSFEIAFPC
jgi:hypothetical protein